MRSSEYDGAFSGSVSAALNCESEFLMKAFLLCAICDIIQLMHFWGSNLFLSHIFPTLIKFVKYFKFFTTIFSSECVLNVAHRFIENLKKYDILRKPVLNLQIFQTVTILGKFIWLVHSQSILLIWSSQDCCKYSRLSCPKFRCLKCWYS